MRYITIAPSEYQQLQGCGKRHQQMVLFGMRCKWSSFIMLYDNSCRGTQYYPCWPEHTGLIMRQVEFFTLLYNYSNPYRGTQYYRERSTLKPLSRYAVLSKLARAHITRRFEFFTLLYDNPCRGMQYYSCWPGAQYL